MLDMVCLNIVTVYRIQWSGQGRITGSFIISDHYNPLVAEFNCIDCVHMSLLTRVQDEESRKRTPERLSHMGGD